MAELGPNANPTRHPLGLGSRRLTSRREAAVDLGVHLLVPHVASDLLHRLSDDGDSQHEALQKREREGVVANLKHRTFLFGLRYMVFEILVLLPGIKPRPWQ